MPYQGSLLRRVTFAGALVAALAAAAPAGEGEPALAEIGDVLPDLRLPTIDGEQTIQLSDYRGKKVLLIEFASW